MAQRGNEDIEIRQRVSTFVWRRGACQIAIEVDVAGTG
jgi:hypothetical protein